VQRIFLGLATVATLLLVANLLVGLTAGDYNAAAHAYYQQGEKLRELQSSGAAAEEVQVAQVEHQRLRDEAKALQPSMTRHMLLGIVAALMTLLACSISITYFVGTSKWFKEVVETYKLEQSFVAENDGVKRRSFRWSVFGALAILAVVGLGAAAEPTWANAERSDQFVAPHYVAALASIALLVLSFAFQAMSLAENGRLIERVMVEVRRIRQERGLAVEPDPAKP
jgi:hypothetical protein